MNKSELKKFFLGTIYGDEVIIPPSIFFSEEHDEVLFTTYDKYGFIFRYYINFDDKYAERQYISEITLNDAVDISENIF